MIFVGERRSPTAITRGWTWKDGHLAARPLFDGLTAIGIDPADVAFVNLFREAPNGHPPGCGPNVVNPATTRRLRSVSVPIIALGYRVSDALARLGIAHVYLTHPAARGRIRKRSRYLAHVRATIGPLL